MMWEFSFQVEAEHAELVAGALLACGCRGTAEDVPLGRTGRRRLRGWLFPPAERIRDEALSHLRRALRAARIEALADLEPDARLVPCGGWEEAWKERWHPFRVGCFVILPLGEQPVLRAGDHPLRIEPGGAFGTGLHASTRLCLLELRDLQRSGWRPRHGVLDVGTGSGVLSLAAEALGWLPATALEIDQPSCLAARANLIRSASAVRLVCAAPAALRGAASLVLANLETTILLELAREFRRLSRPRAVLIASGIAATRFAEVDRTLAAQGFALLSRRERGKWAGGRWMRG